MYVAIMRRLIHIPIIHNAAGLGSLSTAVQAHYASVCHGAAWHRREEMINALWDDIETGLDALGLDPHRTRIFQDGLPICGFEERIVRELAKAGSRNHQLILRWLDRGAILSGTEDARLLMEEYEMHKQRLSDAGNASRTPVDQEQEAKLHRLLEARDAFLSERIAATLAENEVGLLFLGASHRLDGFQGRDIRVETLGEALNEAVRRPGT
jgi:hypothetical protein